MRQRIELLRDEEIQFEDERVVLTNRRLIGNFGRANEGDFDHSELREVGPPNRFNGGHVSRRDVGVKLAAASLAILVIGVWLQETIGLHRLLEIASFLAGSLGLTIGIYLLINGLFRNAPNTTLIFPVISGADIIVSFPDWDNPAADELMRRFARIKRGIGT